jgi:UDP-N-acetylglucosamine 2-epimerase (non-hydrolysing)
MKAQKATNMRIKVSVIFGTRPEAIKLAPVILELKKNKRIDCRVCVTAQHRQLLDQVLEVFGIAPDVDLKLMRPNQTLAGLTARATAALERYMGDDKPDLVLVQGDTTTVFVASLVAFYNRIPVGHVEAGLRTGNLYSPWPEEANRVLTTRIASLHFSPTPVSRENLLKEGIDPKNIIVTGNTVIDALLLTLREVRKAAPKIKGLDDLFLKGKHIPRIVLITGHRRENFGKGFEAICLAIRDLAQRFPDVHYVYPVHLNPNVRAPVIRMLGNHGGRVLPNVHLIDPLPYLPFVALMYHSRLILTDSGGIQEEAPSIGKPVLVMRDTSERPEALTAGTAKLVGTSKEKIVREVSRLLTDENACQEMSRQHNPYGDGRAAKRIVKAIMERYHWK